MANDKPLKFLVGGFVSFPDIDIPDMPVVTTDVISSYVVNPLFDRNGMALFRLVLSPTTSE